MKQRPFGKKKKMWENSIEEEVEKDWTKAKKMCILVYKPEEACIFIHKTKKIIRGTHTRHPSIYGTLVCDNFRFGTSNSSYCS